MAICAEATREELTSVLAAVGYAGDVADLRRPDTGLVMVRGRAGGDGAPFNLGEATVSRAAVALPEGERGFAYHLGRDQGKARLAAIVDALWQSGEHRQAVESAIQPIGARLAGERATESRRTAATRVNFFTMVRGED